MQDHNVLSCFFEQVNAETSQNKCYVGIITYLASLRFWQVYNINDNQTKISREDHLYLLRSLLLFFYQISWFVQLFYPKKSPRVHYLFTYACREKNNEKNKNRERIKYINLIGIHKSSLVLLIALINFLEQMIQIVYTLYNAIHAGFE